MQRSKAGNAFSCCKTFYWEIFVTGSIFNCGIFLSTFWAWFKLFPFIILLCDYPCRLEYGIKSYAKKRHSDLTWSTDLTIYVPFYMELFYTIHQHRRCQHKYSCAKSPVFFSKLFKVDISTYKMASSCTFIKPQSVLIWNTHALSHIQLYLQTLFAGIWKHVN